MSKKFDFSELMDFNFSIMGNKDRFFNLMNYKEVDRVPVNLVGIWNDTLERWKKEMLYIIKTQRFYIMHCVHIQ
ncbi:MAG: hypothetical protein NC917_06195 [Candidatus Omnitrophica bacterium]|nr:hypothetical protein [Candidatus Omnitrophota bacterium]MCM8811218.1 hypothetical protein [Candidatus Omnitrophota bacterium]